MPLFNWLSAIALTLAFAVTTIKKKIGFERSQRQRMDLENEKRRLDPDIWDWLPKSAKIRFWENAGFFSYFNIVREYWKRKSLEIIKIEYLDFIRDLEEDLDGRHFISIRVSLAEILEAERNYPEAETPLTELIKWVDENPSSLPIECETLRLTSLFN